MMKNIIDPGRIVIILFVICILAFTSRCKQSSNKPGKKKMEIVQFREIDSLFANPGQGFMTMRRRPEGEMRFPYTVVYRSFTWADAEPERGEINWSLIDDVIEAWKPYGATVAFRVMTCNAHSRGYYSSPKWLFDEGCKGFEFIRGGATFGGNPITRIEPDYSDPIFLKRHGEFIAALGRRYDDNPDIEFIDIGSYGIWGEWHTPNWAPVEVRKKIVDFYLAAFKKTQLVFMSDGAEVLQYGLQHGTGMRRDGVGSTWHEQNWIGSERYADVTGMAEAWKHAPIVFEWYGRYDHLISQGWSFDAAVNFVLTNHVTLMNDNVGQVPEEAMEKLEKITRLAGARLVLRELEYMKDIKAGNSLTIKMKWANVGVGKLYYPYVLRLFLLDIKDKPVFTAEAKANPTDWLPGEYEITEIVKIPDTLQEGEYKLALALEDPHNSRRPFLLAIDAPEKAGRYILCKINVHE
jgi:hypothetical protein